MVNGKPVICVTSDSNHHAFEKDGQVREICAPRAYSAAISGAGGVPVVAMELCPQELASLCDGLLLSGGSDVEPSLYGEEVLNDTVSCDPERTAFEVPLMQAFLDQGKPILTICRGFQLLNCVLGGSLYQDLVEQKGWVHMNGKIRHDVYTEKGSILNQIFGDVVKTNSTHHQAIHTLAPGLRATARSVEGIIEAYEHETLPVFGTQFHPERLTGVTWDGRTPDYAPYFRHFIQLVTEHAKK